MANEYLQRTPTSTGNRRVWTWSAWIKKGTSGVANPTLFSAGNNNFVIRMDDNSSSDKIELYHYNGSTYDYRYITNLRNRDVSSWLNIVLISDTTASTSSDRIKIYINGSLVTDFGTRTDPSINFLSYVSNVNIHSIGANNAGGSPLAYYNGYISDIFFIDGQALTPDVFGFYKQGKGYISVGSTQSTDFRPGQWVPKTPRVIKTEIIRRGGFGVNGFYLPMNDSKNFGADFHCDPNSIITLNEKIPQPRVGVATTASVGLGYTDALRADPYAANLVLALPFVSGGLSSGFGDYAPSIKGSGSAKTITNNSSVSIANTHGYYGSSVYIDSVNYLSVSSADFAMGTGDFTVEGWINQTGGDTTYGGMFSTSKIGGGTGIGVARDQCWLGNNSVAVSVAAPGGTFWPLNQWTHIAFVRKTNIISVFVNGVAAGITTNVTSDVGETDAAIGRRYYNSSSFTPIAYIQDLRIYKGVAKYKGGFDVPKPYTPVGIATWRAVPDTTANNFATHSPLDYQTSGTYGSSFPILTEGNTLYTHGTTAQWERSNATVGIPTTRSWYMEYNIVTRPASPPGTSENWAIGLRESDGRDYHKCTDGYEDIGDHIYWIDGGTAKIISSQDRTAGSTSGISTMVNGDILNIAVTRTSVQSKIWFGKNGNYFNSGNPASGTNAAITTSTTSSYLIPSQAWYQYSGQNEPVCSVNFGQNPSFGGRVSIGTFTDSNSKGLFKYQPPSGFLALCEDNLPTPAISDPGKYFRTVLYTGTGASRNVVGVGFTPDLIWVKSRTNTEGHIIFDSVRGPEQRLLTMATSTEATTTGGVMSFDSDGYSTAQYTGTNQSGQNYVAWCWRAGAGTTSTNTNGSITSVVSVNQDAGFSIVSWTASGSTSTIGHGLGKVPKFIIAKSRTSIDYGWTNYHTSLGKDAYIMLYSTNASASSSNYWGTSSPSTTVFGVAPSAFNNNSGNMIAYCWAEIEGFSKFGSFIANANSNGPFVYLSFRPALLIVKNTSRSGGWMILDSSRNSTNVVSNFLESNDSDVEASTEPRVDFLSNGFKVRAGSGYTPNDTSGDVYIFAAWAESPFQTANAK